MSSTTGTTRIRTAGCPACSHNLAFIVKGFTSIYRCARCEAIYGSCYLGDSYSLVLPWMVQQDPPAGRVRYFDFECLRTLALRHFAPRLKAVGLGC